MKIKTLSLTLLLALPLTSFGLARTELIPPNGQFDIRISNTVGFFEQVKKSSFGKLWADPQFQDFLGNPDKDIWQEVLFDGEASAESEMMAEQFKMLKGEVIIAMAGDSEEPYMIMSMSEDDFRRSLVLDDKLAKSSDSPFDIVRSTFQGVDLIEHISDPGTDSESHSWQAYLQNTVVMGPSREWVEKSIVQLKKDSVEEPEGNPVLNVNVPLTALIRDLVQEMQEEQQAGVDAGVLFNALGVMGVERFAMRVEFKDDEMIIDNALTATGLDKGIFTLLDTEPTGLPSVGFIPENITMLETGRFNLLRFWREIPMVISLAAPALRPQFDMVLGVIRQQTGIDPELDLLANIGTRYIGFASLENDVLNTVIALELKDSQAFRHGLETLLNAPAIQPQVAASLNTVNFLDHTLYVSKYADPADASAFAVAGNYLLYGQPEGVRQVIRNLAGEAQPNTRFEQTELVQGLRSHLPPTAFGCSAVDWNKNMAYIIRELTRPELTRALVEQWATSEAPIPPPDFSKLPPTDHLAAFFNKTYQYVEKTGSGLHQQIIMKY